MIITLCGSARFERHYHAWNKILTLSGHTVFGLTAYPSTEGGNKDWYDDETKRLMDEAHFRKIEASDAVFFINRFGYMGESTMAEARFAFERDKIVYFMESWGIGFGINNIGNGGRHNDGITELCQKYLGKNWSASPMNTTTGCTVRFNGESERYDVHDVYAGQRLLPFSGDLRTRLIRIRNEADAA